MPHCLWLFDMQTLRQTHLIMQMSARHIIKHVHWNPVFGGEFMFLSYPLDTEPDPHFTLPESSKRIYVWRESRGMQVIDVPACKLILLISS